MVLGDYFEKHGKTIPKDEAIVFKDRRIDYGAYDRETDRMAMGLLKLGIRRGDRVGIYLPLWPETLFIYFGAAKIGAVGIPMSIRTTAPELKFFINDAEISEIGRASCRERVYHPV